MKYQLTQKLFKLSLLTTAILLTGEQLGAFAANNSVIVTDKVNCGDIKALRQNSSGFQVYLDPPHANKPLHFEVNAILSPPQRQNLGKTASQTFSKFKFGTQEVAKNQNRLKFEVSKYGTDLTKGLNLRPTAMTPVNICP